MLYMELNNRETAIEIRHKDLVIEEENPFANCKLGRKENASVLTEIIESYADGFVLALNNKWGTGKTTFVKMWEQHLKNGGFKTMYFNAWENDFEMEPLVAMLGELKKLLGNTKSNIFDSLLEKGAIISKRILPSVVKAVTKKYLGDEVADIISDSAKAATDILKDEVEEYIKKKENLLAFKKELEEYVKKNSNGKPIIFIIDELDRCRPDYAVEVLEKVKHFFSVPGIIFILSIDKEQLGYAIQGYYGSSKIDTDEYLRRFIDLEYQLPKPDTDSYTKYLFDYFSFDGFFKEQLEKKNDKNNFVSFSMSLCNLFNYTLRQYEKLFAFTRVVLRSIHKDTKNCSPDFILLLVHLKLFNENLYKQIKDKNLTTQQLVDEFETLFLTPKSERINDIIYLEAQLVFYYHQYLDEEASGHSRDISLFIESSQSESKEFTLTSKTSEMSNIEYDLEKCVEYIEENQLRYYPYHFSYFLNIIELLNNLQTN